MEQLVRRAIDNYAQLKKEAAIFERRLEARENAEMREALTLRTIQISAIESWFTLLDTDEKVALRQTLQANTDDDGDCPLSTTWYNALITAGISPLRVREKAISKIISFATAHNELINAIFVDLIPSSFNHLGTKGERDENIQKTNDRRWLVERDTGQKG